MNLVFSTDNNYCVPLYASLNSFFRHNGENHSISIIYNNINETNKEKIDTLIKTNNSKCTWIEYSVLTKGMPEVEGFPESAFARLYLENLPEELDKVLYVDCDTAFNDNIDDLWNKDISEFYLAAVLDMVKPHFRSQIGLPMDALYYNSGLLLINLKKWRKENISKQFSDFIISFKGSVPHNDQGVINAVCKGEILTLKPHYNITTGMLSLNWKEIIQHYSLQNFYNEPQFQDAVNNPIIVHFTEGVFGRPWQSKSNHPYKSLYFSNIKGSGLEDTEVGSKVDTSVKLIGLLQKVLPFSVYTKLVKIKDKLKYKGAK